MVGGMGSIIGDIPVFVTDVNVSSRAHEAGLKVTFFCLKFFKVICAPPCSQLSSQLDDVYCFLAFCLFLTKVRLEMKTSRPKYHMLPPMVSNVETFRWEIIL